MNYDQSKCDAGTGVVQTASVGDSEMVTYMPNMNVAGNVNVNMSDCRENENEGSEDDGTFLDGLFDHRGSDSGSDKGDNNSSGDRAGANVEGTAQASDCHNSPKALGTVENSASTNARVYNSMGNAASSMNVNVNVNMNGGMLNNANPIPITSAPNCTPNTNLGCTPSAGPATSPAQQSTTVQQSTIQLPQHLLYHVQHQPLPTNLLQQQQQQQPPPQPQGALQQIQQLQQQIANANSTQTNTVIQLQPWMMNAAMQLGVQSPMQQQGQPQAQPQVQQQPQAAQLQMLFSNQQVSSSSQTQTAPGPNQMQNPALVPNRSISAPQTLPSDAPQTNVTQQQSVSNINAMVPPPRVKVNRKRPNLNTDTCPTPTDTQSSIAQSDFPSSVSEDESDATKRRRERNQREQERSQRIASQIANLKELLSQSKVSFKPDKYSTLVSVFQYITSLKTRVSELDEEHAKIMNTITKTNEIVNRSQLGNQAFVPDAPGSSTSSSCVVQEVQGNSGTMVQVVPDTMNNTESTNKEEEELLYYVRGLDYKRIFFRCDIAMCVARIDGKLVDCNDEFVKLCKLNEDVLKAAGILNGKSTSKSSPSSSSSPLPPLQHHQHQPQSSLMPDQISSSSVHTVAEKESPAKKSLSLFNFLARNDMAVVFGAMSTMLKSSTKTDSETEASNLNSQPAFTTSNFWCHDIEKLGGTKEKVRINVSLVRLKNGTPKFFNCAFYPI